MRENMRRFFSGVVVGVLLLVALPARTEQPGSFVILSPSPGEVIMGNTVQVKIALPEGLRIVDPAVHTVNLPGEGHLHIWLDALPRHDDAVSISISEGASEHTYPNVFSGLHTVYAEFLRNDHSPFDPKMSASVEFETVGTVVSPGVVDGASASTDNKGERFFQRGKGSSVGVLIGGILIGVVLWFLSGRNKKP